MRYVRYSAHSPSARTVPNPRSFDDGEHGAPISTSSMQTDDQTNDGETENPMVAGRASTSRRSIASSLMMNIGRSTLEQFRGCGVEDKDKYGLIDGVLIALRIGSCLNLLQKVCSM